MKTQIIRTENFEDNRVIVDGVDITKNVLEVSTRTSREGAEVFIELTPHAEQEVSIEGAVYVLMQPDDLVVMKRLKEVLASLDPGEVESAALARMQWGGSQKVAYNVLDAIKDVIQYACDELEAAAKVRGGPDDRHDPGQEAAESE